MAKERHPLAPAAAPQPPPQHSAHHPHSHPHSHPPANITVVRTARELQEASLRGALDIEIRAHLDLRTLDLAQDPSGLFSGTVQEFGRRSLLYADLSMRSIRGNCSDPDAAGVLRLDAATATDLLPLKPRQCLLVTHEPLLSVNSGKVWLDGVYLLLRRTAVRPRMAFIAAGTALQDEVDPPQIQRSDFYATNVTFHGEPRGCARAYFSDAMQTRAFFGDCIFTGWNGFESPLTLFYRATALVTNSVFRNMRLTVELADVSFGSTVRFLNTRFANVSLASGAIVGTTTNDFHLIGDELLEYDPEDDAEFDVAVAAVPPAERGVWGADYVIEDDMMSDCLFLGFERNVTMPGCSEAAAAARRELFDRYLVEEYGAVGVGGEHDGGSHWVAYEWEDPNDEITGNLIHEETPWFAETLKILPPRAPAPPDWPPFTVDLPPGGPPPSALRAASVTDAGLAQRVQLVPEMPSDRIHAPEGDAGRCAAEASGCGGGGGGGGMPAWGRGLVLALLAAAVLAAIAALWAWVAVKRRRPRNAYLPAGAASGSSGMHSSDALLLSHGATAAAAAGSIELAHAATTTQEARLSALFRKLDRCGRSEHALLGKFELLGPAERCLGGSTVVQFARGCRDMREYAVKFFLDVDAFESEATLYAAHTPALRTGLAWPLAAKAAAIAADAVSAAAAAAPAAAAAGPRAVAEAAEAFLPEVAAVSDGTHAPLQTPQGRGLPPCVVTLRGESLLEWSNRAAPDVFASLSILSQVSLRLANMHAAGHVHRSIKPTSIVLLPRAKRWVLSSFTSAARIGSRAPLRAALAYSAPEVVHAYDRGDREVLCLPELDSWSLGVLAFELFTGGPAFRMTSAGREQVLAMLRGEEPLPWEGPSGEAAVVKLGVLKGPLMALLQREPAQRASMRRFHVACTRVFAARSTMEASAVGSITAAAAAPRMPSMASVSGADGARGGATTVWLGDAEDLGVTAHAVTEHSTFTSDTA